MLQNLPCQRPRGLPHLAERARVRPVRVGIIKLLQRVRKRRLFIAAGILVQQLFRKRPDPLRVGLQTFGALHLPAQVVNHFGAPFQLFEARALRFLAVRIFGLAIRHRLCYTILSGFPRLKTVAIGLADNGGSCFIFVFSEPHLIYAMALFALANVSCQIIYFSVALNGLSVVFPVRYIFMACSSFALFRLRVNQARIFDCP